MWRKMLVNIKKQSTFAPALKTNNVLLINKPDKENKKNL